ncbi:MAG: hypothetical protein ACI4RM_01150 [Ruminococcus sp.]
MKKSFSFTKQISRKNLILSVVALILTIMMIVGSTYSWIENITAVQITNVPQGGTGADPATLGIANDISETIVLGSCGPDDDDGSVSKFSAINLGSYFNESGDTHLTTCSGNGNSFYFKTLKGSTNAKSYRIGTEDDENVNYISATFKVCSPDAEVDMWFDKKPSVTMSEGSIQTDDIACYSITVDGETNVYSASGDNYNHIIDADGTTSAVSTRKTAAYTYGDKDNTDNKNVLFRVGEDPKEVTIRIWLQSTADVDSYTDLKPDVNMVLVSTWAKTRKITIRDCTSQNMNEYWMTDENSPKLYVALASDPDKYHWELTVDTTTKIGSVDIPSYYYTGDKIIVLRCENGWNTGNVQCQGVWCWNYWETDLQKGFEDLVFNIVGNTPAINDGSTKQSDTGYSFWGEAEKITVTDNAGLKHDNENVNRLLVRDEDTGNYYPLYNDGQTWTGYVPRTSDKLEFLYKKDGFQNNAINSKNSSSSSDSCYKNEASSAEYRWGYNKNDTTPQTRPYDDLTYTILSTTEGTWKDLIKTQYSLAGYFNGSSTWDSSSIFFYKENEDDTQVFASITLNKDTLNQIKVKDTTGSGTYYSNSGVMCRSNCTSWTMSTDVSQNMGFITDGYDGTYKFYLDTTTMKLTAEYPGSGGKSRVYLVTNYNGYYKYAYMWKTENGNTSSNGSYPGQKMDCLGNIGDYYIYQLKYTDGIFPNKVIFSGQGNESNTDQKWQTINLDFTGYQIYTNPTKK